MHRDAGGAWSENNERTLKYKRNRCSKRAITAHLNPLAFQRRRITIAREYIIRSIHPCRATLTLIVALLFNGLAANWQPPRLWTGAPENPTTDVQNQSVFCTRYRKLTLCAHVVQYFNKPKFF